MPGRRFSPTIAVAAVASLCAWCPDARASPPGDAAPAPSSNEPEPAPAPPGAEEPEPAPTGPTPTGPAPAVTEIETAPPPEGGGVAGPVVSADDPAARQAQADLEGEALDRNATGVPTRMPALRTAAWWTMFGAVALGTVGGIFSGLAERREDEAERLALGFDLETGRRFVYEEHAEEYASILDEGVRFQWTSRGFLIGAGAALVTSITLFAVQAKRERDPSMRAHARQRRLGLRRLGPDGVEVAF